MPPSTSPKPPFARRLMGRAVDLLVIAFLATVVLAIGQQVIDWWRIEETPGASLASRTTVDLDWNQSPVQLEFGNATTSLERIPFHGGRKQVEEELTRLGKSLVDKSAYPASALIEGEREMLDALRTTSPVFWDSTRGNVYRRYEPLPSFYSTVFPEPSSDAGIDPHAERIVAWGIAFPTSLIDWTILVFHPGKSLGALDFDSPESVLPDGAQNVTTMKGATGCQWRVFQGRGRMTEWVQHFDRQYGTKSVVIRNVGDQTTTLKYRREKVSTEILIREESDGQLTGVCWSSKEEEQE